MKLARVMLYASVLFFVLIIIFSPFVSNADPLDVWHTRNSSIPDWLYGIAHGNDIFIAVGAQGRILTSATGVNWEIRSSPTTSTLSGVTFGKGTFVAVGTEGTILTSPTGIDWTPRASNVTSTLKRVTFGNGTFVAVGIEGASLAGGNRGTILASTDGVNWTKDPENPVLSPGPSGTWDSYSVAGMSVLENSGKYKMWYFGSKLSVATCIGYAEMPHN